MKLATFPALVLLALAMVIFNACSDTGTSLTGEWRLVSYGDTSIPTPALPGVDTSISFNEGQFGGTVGCNSFVGDYKVNDNQLTIGSIISTMMYCDQTSTQENAVLALLSDQTVKFQIEGNNLTLSSMDGSAIIKLERK